MAGAETFWKDLAVTLRLAGARLGGVPVQNVMFLG